MLSQPDLAAAADPAEMAERAIGFLLARQRADGAWHDFFLPAGESDGWVTGYVGLALATRHGPRGRQAAARGWAYLQEVEKPNGGWGYNALTPADADSSLWALRLADAIGAGDSAAARRGRAFLDGHRRNGGIATYADKATPRHYVGLPPSVDFDAWTLPHVCVTAAAAGLEGVPNAELRAWLAASQEPDGHWPSYWWFDPGYATAEAAEALGDDAVVEKARHFARVRLAELLRDPVPSAFALAHVVRILGRETPDDALEALATHQDPNGSWPASARLRVPTPDCVTPADAAPWKPWRGLAAMPATLQQVIDMTFTITSLDHRRVFTTATVLRALQAVGA